MKVFNTLTRTKEELVPITPGEFKIYACGPTVYNLFHLGNARPFITYDTLRRYLEYRGNKVHYVQNFTDIDDKVIDKANDEGITIKELTDRMIEEYFVDADGLGIRRATVHPRATEHIPAIIDMIQTLEDKGYAYVLDDGVYFEMERFKDYGKLSRYNLDELEHGSGAASRLAEDKRNPMDFVLWKFKKEGEPFWPSPWGDGRPGWHIECSAMVRETLGETIDIHGGGQDLIFPHHENEIAQSEAANDKPFVNYWLHNGFINVDGEKMAKSDGNYFLVRELAKDFPYEVIRFFMLQAHYRMPINFTHELLEAAEQAWRRIKQSVANLDFVLQSDVEKPDDAAATETLSEAISKAKTGFVEAMDDDLNTADAFAEIFDLVRAANIGIDRGAGRATLQAARDQIVELTGVLGLDPAKQDESAIPQEILDLVEQRAAAKKAKDFALADRLRDEVAQAGFRIDDTPQGPKVSRVTPST